jgi:hypothetical protein
MKNKNLKILYAGAFDYLKNIIGQEALEEKTDHYRQYKPDTLPDIFWHLVYSLTNKRGMRATIGDIDEIGPSVFEFDPLQTCAHEEDDWQTLCTDIKNHYTPPGPMNIENQSSFWVILCKGILSGAYFLSQFETYDAFDDFVNSFAFNDISIAALPMVLEQEIYGFGFALGCDWLKEIGYGNYGKPDTHTIDILFETGVCDTQDNYDIFKCMVRMARVCKEPVAGVDYLLWLIGSGKYVEKNEKITRQKAMFISQIRPKLKPQ